MPTGGQADLAPLRGKDRDRAARRSDRPPGAAVVQHPPHVPDRGGCDPSEDPVDDRQVIAEQRCETLGARVEGACADEGEASHIRGARLQVRGSSRA